MLTKGQAGFVADAETERSMRLYVDEGFPRLKRLEADSDPAETSARGKAMKVIQNAPLDSMTPDFVR